MLDRRARRGGGVELDPDSGGKAVDTDIQRRAGNYRLPAGKTVEVGRTVRIDMRRRAGFRSRQAALNQDRRHRSLPFLSPAQYSAPLSWSLRSLAYRRYSPAKAHRASCRSAV